jgi:protein-disulfide isomerase
MDGIHALRFKLLLLLASFAVLTGGTAVAAEFTVVNDCGYTLYPGIFPADYANGGWQMAPGTQVSFRPGQPALKPRPTLSVAGEPFKGDPAAKLAIIEYADFQCPFCRRFEHDIYPQIRASYVSSGKLKFFHRDMPLAFHQGAMPAARAVHCATEQGKFWEMHDTLLGDAASLSAADIDERAGKLGLNVTELDSCISSDRFAAIIQRSVTEANEMQISGTPTFIIGTLDAYGEVMSVKKTVVGAASFDSFKAALDPLLAPAG